MNAHIVAFAKCSPFQTMLQTCDHVVLSFHPLRNVQTQPRILSDHSSFLTNIDDAIIKVGGAQHLLAHRRSLRGMNEAICPASVNAQELVSTSSPNSTSSSHHPYSQICASRTVEQAGERCYSCKNVSYSSLGHLQGSHDF
jgi:hypothetical protein